MKKCDRCECYAFITSKDIKKNKEECEAGFYMNFVFNCPVCGFEEIVHATGIIDMERE